MPGKLGGDLLDCFSVHGAILDVFSGTEGIEADVLRVVRRVNVLLHAAETDDRSAEGRRFYAGDPATLANQSQPEEDPRRRAACATVSPPRPAGYDDQDMILMGIVVPWFPTRPP